MYPTSSAYKTAMYSLGRDRISSRVTIGENIITQDDSLQSWVLTRDTQTNNAIIGNAISKSAEIAIIDKDGYTVNVGDELTIEIGARLSDGSIEWIPMTTLYVSKIERDEVKKVLALTCDDALQKAKAHKIAELPEQTYPLTLRDYVRAVCLLCGLELSSTAFFNNDLVLSEAPNLSGSETCFNVLGWAAAAALSNAVIDRVGELAFVTPLQTFDDGTVLTADNYINFEKNQRYGPINSLVLGRSPAEDNVYAQDADSIALNGLTEYRIDNNPFLDYGDADKRYDIINTLFTKINGFYFWPFSTPWQGDPAIDEGDRIKIVSPSGIAYETTYFGDKITYNGGLRIESQAVGPEVTSTNYAYGVTQKDIKRTTEITTDKVNGQITLLTQEINKTQTDLTTQTASIIQTANSINLKVEQNTQDLTNLANLTATTIEQTADEIRFEFSQLNNLDVDSINNAINNISAYFDFGASGLDIGKTGDPMQLNVSNDHISFKDSGATVMTITGQTMNISEVEVTTSIIIGKHKFETFNNNMTIVRFVG